MTPYFFTSRLSVFEYGDHARFLTKFSARKKRSTDIRSKLKIFNSTEKIEKQNENWHGHILRMTTDRLPKTLLNYKPRGYRNIGRPIARWEDAFS
jgi:hypothetical protein